MADGSTGAAPPQGPGGPLLEYPLDYPFKVIGLASDDFAAHVRALVQAAMPGAAAGEPELRPSSGGKYLSVTLTVRLASEDERRGVYLALSRDPRVLQYL
jgi:putative lipoic acid-binding regulatory protein